MPRHVCAALGAAMLVAASALTPAAAGEQATLRVTARVVDRCTVEVPFHVPPWVWRHRRDEPWRFVRHHCQGKPPFWVHFKEVLLERLRDRFEDRFGGYWRGHAERARGGRIHEVRHPRRRDVILITVTY